MDNKSRKVIGQYKNGNYTVYLFEDGTKIRFTEADIFTPDFPESIDFCCTKRCKIGCQFCYENCLPTGNTWNFNQIMPLLLSLKEYTEIAVNGNDLMDIPNLTEFLTLMKERKIFVNMTFHFMQYKENVEQIIDLQRNGLIYGIGVSINQEYNISDLQYLSQCNNVVIHTVAGIFSPEIYKSLIELHKITSVKLLILGYKQKGRGQLYEHLYPEDVKSNMQWLDENIMDIMNDGFDVVSFDNLALTQLHIQDKVTKDIWESHYMGDDGQFTMYIDAVNMKYAVNSLTDEQNVIDTFDIDTLFKIVQKQREIKQAEIEIEKLDL